MRCRDLNSVCMAVTTIIKDLKLKNNVFRAVTILMGAQVRS